MAWDGFAFSFTALASRCSAAAVALLVLLVLTPPVLACRGYQFEQRILLDEISPAMEKSEVIAEVEIIDVSIRQLPELIPLHFARARILKSIRGVVEGQIIQIFAERTSCGGGLDQRAVGRKGFIAGRFQPMGGEIAFHGRWSLTQLGKVPKYPGRRDAPRNR